VVLWDTPCLNIIVEQLRGSGQAAPDEEVARLSTSWAPALLVGYAPAEPSRRT